MRTTFAVVAALMMASAAMASTTTCQGTTLDQYLTPNFSCMSGNLQFSNFGYIGTGNPTGLALQAGNIFVQPLTTTGDEGFQFSAGWNVGTQPGGFSAFQDSLITFTISTVNQQATLDDLSLFFNGSPSGTGLSGVTEQYCLGGPLNNCPAANSGQIKVTNPPQHFNDMITFNTPVSSISVSKDINVTSGINGTATISQVVNTFSQTGVPEPTSYLLLGSGLLGLGMLRKRVTR
jgi:hypothetical protein